jgi:hypothetical protein
MDQPDGENDASGEEIKPIWEDLGKSVEVTRQAANAGVWGKTLADAAVEAVGEAAAPTWRSRVYSAMRYGLLDTETTAPEGGGPPRARLREGPTAQTVLREEPGSPAYHRALATLFWTPPLHRWLLHRFPDGVLPPMHLLDVAMAEALGTTASRASAARQPLIRSARQAGVLEEFDHYPDERNPPEGRVRLLVPAWVHVGEAVAARIPERPRPAPVVEHSEPATLTATAQRPEPVPTGCPPGGKGDHTLGVPGDPPLIYRAGPSAEPITAAGTGEARPSALDAARATAPAASAVERTDPVDLGFQPDDEGTRPVKGASLFLDGLKQTLPEPGEEWPRQDRESWLKLAAMIFEEVYKP